MISEHWQSLRMGAFKRSGGRCQCFGDCGGHDGQCQVRLTVDGFHADHILPKHPRDRRIPRGPDTDANLRALCPGCNQRKSNRITTLPDGPLKRAVVQTLQVFVRLAKVGVPVQPLAPTVAAHVVTLRYLTVPGHAHMPARIASEVRAAVNVPTARIYVHGAELRVELPRWPRRLVTLAEMPPWGLGLDTQNMPVCINLAASPGVLIAGSSGSGKSTVATSILYHVVRSGGRLIVIDPKYQRGGAALRQFRRLAALECAVANTEDEAGNALALALRLMNEREPGERHPMLAVVIDEVQELTAGQRATVERLAKLGREVNVQVIATTQHPTANVVTNALKNQLTWWIAGRVQNASASTLVIGHTGAQNLGGRGDMIVANSGREARIQAALGGTADWAKLAQLAAEPAAAPAVVVGDARYEREPNDDRVAWLVDRFHETGARPSAAAVKRVFRGNTERAMRARDEALELIGAGA